jgi:putative colanic acid biosynthesis acetyltransferase WcaF
MLLILFGAKIAPSARIHNSTKIWAPWNLVMKSRSAMAEHVDCYNVGLVTLEEAAIASQYAYLCTASHAIDDPGFPLVTAPIRLERMSWVAAKAIVGMGVVVGEGGVVALGALALKSVEPWTVVGGVPAKLIKKRQRF